MKALVAAICGASAVLLSGACERKQEAASPVAFKDLPAPAGCKLQVASLAELVPPNAAATAGQATGGEKGLVLANLPTNHPLYQVGLRDGDVLTKINGLPLASPVAALSAFKSIQQRGAATVAYERDAAPQSTTCAIEFGP